MVDACTQDLRGSRKLTGPGNKKSSCFLGRARATPNDRRSTVLAGTRDAHEETEPRHHREHVAAARADERQRDP